MIDAASFKRIVETTPWLLEVKFAFLKPLHWLQYTIKRDPNERSVVVHGARGIISSPEYPFIPKHPDAGTCKGGHLIMHNGVRVLPTCYLGWQNYVMVRDARGVHEPEEERVFMDVLRTLGPGATMVELGAYWAFYSLWFQQAIEGARSVLVEPTLSNLNYGRKNFRINGRKGTFVHAFIGAEEAERNGQRTVTVDSIARESGLDSIDILHADIQGHERTMLDGARELLDAGRRHRADTAEASGGDDRIRRLSRRTVSDAFGRIGGRAARQRCSGLTFRGSIPDQATRPRRNWGPCWRNEARSPWPRRPGC